jgi:hypothetical protein
MMIMITNAAAVRSALLLSVLEVSGSNLGMETGLSFLSPSREMPG